MSHHHESGVRVGQAPRSMANDSSLGLPVVSGWQLGDPKKRLRASRREMPSEWTKIIPPNSEYFDHSKIPIQNSFELLFFDESELFQENHDDSHTFFGGDLSDYEENYAQISNQLFVCNFLKNDLKFLKRNQ